jgi:hypothetical protein
MPVGSEGNDNDNSDTDEKISDQMEIRQDCEDDNEVLESETMKDIANKGANATAEEKET